MYDRGARGCIHRAALEQEDRDSALDSPRRFRITIDFPPKAGQLIQTCNRLHREDRVGRGRRSWLRRVTGQDKTGHRGRFIQGLRDHRWVGWEGGGWKQRDYLALTTTAMA